MDRNSLYKSLTGGGFQKTAGEFFDAFSDSDLEKLAEELAANISEEDKETKKENNEEKNMDRAGSNHHVKDVSETTGDNAEALTQKAKEQISDRVEPVADSFEGTERTASEEEINEMIKEAAFAMTEEVLGSLGISPRDYIMSKVADEAVADSIEKRASTIAELSGTTKLRAADDLLTKLSSMIEK